MHPLPLAPASDGRADALVDPPGGADEQLLITRVREGDAVAFEAIFRRYHRELRARAEGLTRSRPAAEDVVQDVFVAVWRGRARWQVATSLGAYLHRCVRNAAARKARIPQHASLETAAAARERAALELVAPGPSPLDDAEAATQVPGARE